jgi:hypothetical protein
MQNGLKLKKTINHKPSINIFFDGNQASIFTKEEQIFSANRQTFTEMEQP